MWHYQLKDRKSVSIIMHHHEHFFAFPIIFDTIYDNTSIALHWFHQQKYDFPIYICFTNIVFSSETTGQQTFFISRNTLMC